MGMPVHWVRSFSVFNKPEEDYWTVLINMGLKILTSFIILNATCYVEAAEGSYCQAFFPRLIGLVQIPISIPPL